MLKSHLIESNRFYPKHEAKYPVCHEVTTRIPGTTVTGINIWDIMTFAIMQVQECTGDSESSNIILHTTM
jgi:hypothetical protein